MTGFTPFPELDGVLIELRRSLRAILGSNLVGAYLQGSFAVGDADEHSDVDWIVAVEDDLSADEVAALTENQERIYRFDCPWAQHLEGSFFPRNVLRDHERSGDPVWYFDHGSTTLIRSNHCNTKLVRWIVREWGVPLTGPAPDTLIDPIPEKALRREILDVIVNWGEEFIADPDRYRNRFYQGFIVLSYCRMPHDLVRGIPGSKRAGAEWAKANLDPKWVGLIDRSWATRPDPSTSFRSPPDPDDFEATLEFVHHIIDKSRRYAADHDLL